MSASHLSTLQILEEGSDWKGRREQLISLRDQIKQLKASQAFGERETLQFATAPSPPPPPPPLLLAPVCRPPLCTCRPLENGFGERETRHEATARKAIDKAATTRNHETERIQNELAAVKQDYDTLKMKYDGAMSRRKVLENELGSIKEKMSVVLDKTNNDDRLITALKNEVASLKRQATQNANPTGASPPGVVEDEIWQELSILRKRCGEQEKQLDRQEQIILTLNQQLQLRFG
eukprot:gene8753-33614_t